MASLEEAFSKASLIPPRALNGGLYTGEPFAKNAPWANVPVIPDASYMIQYNLRSANPPPGAIFQYPGPNRPGNNTVDMIGVRESQGPYNMRVIDAIEEHEACKCNKCVFNKYSYT